MLFQDSMDHTRVVKQLSQVGDSFVCAVYWRGVDGKQRYGGQTRIHSRMFNKSDQNCRTGFIPISAEVPAKK
jgi:hypothetical protein